MLKKTILIFLQLVLFMSISLSQTKTITGTVTGVDDGLPIPGVSVIIKGTTIGTTTDAEGVFSLDVPGKTQSLIFSFVGMKTKDVLLEGLTELNVTLEPDIFGLDEVIVSGVAANTPSKKLSITVDKLTEEDLKEAPASSVSYALQGKVAGLTVASLSGIPGADSRIRIRGAISLSSFQEPMVIVDGAILSGYWNLADINIDDVESIEVVKGAAASSLYGSQAGNGAIVIHTKRGDKLQKGKTQITFRSEFGRSFLSRKLPLAEHHAYKLADDWESETRFTKFAGWEYSDHPDSIGWPRSGSMILDEDHYMDNPYMIVYDHQEEFFQQGDFLTNYVSVGSNQEKTNFLLSYENSHQQGILSKGGYYRNNFRFNLDHNISEKLRVSTSSLIISTKKDKFYWNAFQEFAKMPPDANLFAKNFIDGSPYRINHYYGLIQNPLYNNLAIDKKDFSKRVIGNIVIDYSPWTSIKFSSRYSVENANRDGYEYWEKGCLVNQYKIYEGDIYRWTEKGITQNFQFTLNFHKSFGEFTTRMKTSYLYESEEWNDLAATGSEFSVYDVPHFEAIRKDPDEEDIDATSSEGTIRARNFFGILDLDYKEKYIGSFLLRYDGSSLFGENERWNPYYRISGAYRISEDLSIPGIQELKIRASYGTSGVRPGYGAKDESYTIENGKLVKKIMGNKNLKPTTVKEIEFGLNIDFLNRVKLDLIYSHTNAEDQILLNPLSAIHGFPSQWQNIGTIQSKSFEATAGIILIESNNMFWDMNFTVYRIRQKVTKLNVPPFWAEARRYISEGEVFGNIYGKKFLRSLDEMQAQIDLLSGVNEQYEGLTIDDFTRNADGYVIEKGTEGTIYEKPIFLLDEFGLPKNTVIGDGNPDFQVGITNTFNYKGFTVYFLLNWQQGGDIYNNTRQWLGKDHRNKENDQYGKQEYQKKTTDYYFALYNENNSNSHFVEDGTFLKVQEVTINYTFPSKLLNRFLKGWIKQVKIGVIGRNLFTFTNYSGFNPEVGEALDVSGLMYDSFNYPNYTTVTGSLELRF